MLRTSSILLFVQHFFSFAYGGSGAFLNELEHLLVDSGGYNDAGFKAGVTPCSFYNQGSQNSGRQSASQWLRVAFHDFAPANVAEGTGGMDGSIGFETDRDENHGAAMNDSLTFFAPFVNKYASMADMIALGSIVAIGSCGGPLIPFKGGRIDATGGGATGVPEEFQDIGSFISGFSRAGLNQTEMIEATACGHTIGSVHQAGFPDVVQNAETPNNTNGGIHFDDTFDVFDNHIATGYLDGTTADPLVTSFNSSVRSDLVVFNSDGNETMKRLASSPEEFATRCTVVLSKLLNTVPRGVNLTSVVPIPLKPVDVNLAIDEQGTMTFSGAIRLLSTAGFPFNSERVVTIHYKDRNGQPCSKCMTQALFNASSSQGTSLFGDTFYHLFSTIVDPQSGISSYSVTVSEGNEPNAKKSTVSFEIQDTVMWLPKFSDLNANSDEQIIGTIAAAVRTTSLPDNVTALLDTPVPQIGAKNPRVATVPIVLHAQQSLGNSNYTLFASPKNAILPSITNMTTALRSSVDIVASFSGESFVDDFRKLVVLALSTD